MFGIVATNSANRKTELPFVFYDVNQISFPNDLIDWASCQTSVTSF